MGKLTPEQIIEDAKYALANNWGYIWGKAGELWTQAKQDAVNNDPNGREQTKKYGQQWVGHYVADCSGLISWIFHKHGLYIAHGSNSQYTKYCTEKGPITNDISLKPGALVFKYSTAYTNPYYHVGVYIGNNKVIEAQGTYKGVIQSTLFGWTHYGYPKGVDYGDISSGSERSDLSVGDKVIVDVPNDGTVNIRKKATTSSDKLGTLPEGTEVEITEIVDSNWCKVKYTGEGYIMSKFLRRESA